MGRGAVLFILISFVLLNGGCGESPRYTLTGSSPSVDHSIVAGEDAEVGSWPFMVSLRDETGSFCGGTLIAPDWVVTAAHCLGRMNPAEVTVLIGAYNLDDLSNASYDGLEPTEELRATEFIVHPDYNRRSDVHDIALVRLEASSTKPVLPIEESGEEFAEGALGIVLGWGALSAGWSSEYSTILQQAELPLLTNADCESKGSDILSDSMICAGYEEGGVDSCVGDSGGPLLRRNGAETHLIGITSFGTGDCAEPGQVGVYTRVSAYLDWIEVARREGPSNESEAEECEEGYEYSEAERDCIDIDECASGVADCPQECVNTQGSYGCECESGFALADDGLSCEPQEFCDDVANRESARCTKSTVTKADGCGGCVSIQGTGMEMLLIGWLLTLRRRRK